MLKKFCLVLIASIIIMCCLDISSVSAINSSIASDTELVYIDKEGIDVKYHEIDCDNIKPNRYYTITVKEAFDKGYRQCPVCNPPMPTEIYEKRKEELNAIIQSINPTTINSTNNSNSSSAEETKTVYITKNSSAYHLAGCTHMNGQPHPISLSQAQSRGYGACEYCKPYVEDNRGIIFTFVISTIIAIIIIITLTFYFIGEYDRRKLNKEKK